MAEKEKQAAPEPDPQDTPDEQPSGPAEAPALSQMGATFGERAAARKQFEARMVDGGTADNKAVRSSSTRKKSR